MKTPRWLILQRNARARNVREVYDLARDYCEERNEFYKKACRMEEERDDIRAALKRQIKARGAAEVWEPPARKRKTS